MIDARVLLVGAGGLGSPAALVLARSGVKRLTLIDDARVDLSNLHRQVLYDDADVGRDKVERAAARLEREGASVEVVRGRLLPSNAEALVSRFDIVGGVLRYVGDFEETILVTDTGYEKLTDARVKWW